MRTWISLSMILAAALVLSPQAYGQADAKKDAEKKEKEPSAQELYQQAVKTAQGGDLPGALDLVRKARKVDPKELQYGLVLVNALQQQGMQKARLDRKAANKMFYEAGQVAGELLAGKQKLPARVKALLANAKYNQACAFATDKKPQEAIKALDAALGAGFSDFEQLGKDKDFADLRGKDEFKKLVAKHRAANQKRILDDAKKLLASQKPKFDLEFKLTSIDGKEISSASYKGKVLIADFWGTWCPPCRAEIPHFVKLKKLYAKKGLEIVGLNYERGGDDEAKINKIKKFAQEFGINYPCVLGDDATRAQVPNFRGYPTTVFIDRRGEVRLTLVGLQSYEKLEAIVKTLLAE